MMKNVLLILLLGLLAVLGSCKKCYVCTKQNATGAYGADSTFQFEQCNKGKYSNGQNMKDALKSYEANGYQCIAK